MPKQKIAEDNSRNPTNKRGWPKDPVREHLRGRCRSRNQVDMIVANLGRRHYKLIPEVLRLIDRRKSPWTLLGYLARFPPEQQLEQFRFFDKLALGLRSVSSNVETVPQPKRTWCIGSATGL